MAVEPTIILLIEFGDEHVALTKTNAINGQLRAKQNQTYKIRAI